MSQITWVVCEETGRWAAALRLEFARIEKGRRAPGMREVRSLAELKLQLNEHAGAFSLIEIGQLNLASVLELVAHREPAIGRFAALLSDTSDRMQTIADVAWEAGAIDVIESPRHVHRLVAICGQLSATRPYIEQPASDRAFAEWALSTLPWQDA
jgi:hypothetical protein